VVVRDGEPVEVDVTTLVPGDVVEVRLGDVVPADVRLLTATGLECDESVLTGESLPVDKNPDPVPAGTPLAELTGCALMGTVVHAGSGRGVVVTTGPRTEFGKIAAGLDTRPLDTAFQVGLRKFSMLLVYVAGALTTSIFVMNVVLHKPIIDALLFSLAIAVGITPQLLPAVVSTSLAAGSRRMSRRKVLVKRLVWLFLFLYLYPYGKVIGRDLAPVPDRIHFCEFGPEVENHRRVIYPDKDHDDRTCGPVNACHITLPDIKAD